MDFVRSIDSDFKEYDEEGEWRCDFFLVQCNETDLTSRVALND